MSYFIHFCFVFSFALVHAQESFIQIIAEPEIKVLLDDEVKGITNSDVGGLIIENVASGKHTLKLIKQGFNEQSEVIRINKGEVFSYTVNPFIPSIKIIQKGNEDSQILKLSIGSLKIQSLPISCAIKIPELSISQSKTEDVWLGSNIPIGFYKATFIWNDNILETCVEVKNREESHYFIDFINCNIIKNFNKEESVVNNLDTNSKVAINNKPQITTSKKTTNFKPDAIIDITYAPFRTHYTDDLPNGVFPTGNKVQIIKKVKDTNGREWFYLKTENNIKGWSTSVVFKRL